MRKGRVALVAAVVLAGGCGGAADDGAAVLESGQRRRATCEAGQVMTTNGCEDQATTTASSTTSTQPAPETTLPPTAPLTTAPAPAFVPPAAPELQFPAGYPREVQLSEVPRGPRNFIERGGGATATAVQLAPGAWTPRGLSTTIEQDAATGGFYGFCSDVPALEQQLGDERGGTCW